MTNFLPLLLAVATLGALGMASRLRRLRRYHAWWEAEYAATRHLATGRSVDVLTRRRGARWEVAVVTPLSADRGAGV